MTFTVFVKNPLSVCLMQIKESPEEREERKDREKQRREQRRNKRPKDQE